MNMNDENPNPAPNRNPLSHNDPKMESSGNRNPMQRIDPGPESTGDPNPMRRRDPGPESTGNPNVVPAVTRSGRKSGPEEVAQKLRDASGNVMLRAGAGTGKTFNLTQKVLHLLTVRKVRLDQILVLTFTDFAAAEMRERIYDGLNKAIQKAEDPDLRNFLIREKREFPSNYISTFHSFCNRILQYYPDDVSMLEVSEFPQHLDNTPYGKAGKIRLDTGFEILGGYEEIVQKQEIRRDYYRIYKDSRVLKNQLNNLKAPDLEAFCGKLQDLGAENLVRLSGLTADGYIGILRGITDELKAESDELFGRVSAMLGEYRDDIKDEYLTAAAKGVGNYLGLSNNDGKIPKKFIHKHADKDEIVNRINPLNTRLKTVNALIDSIEATISDPALDEKLEKYRESGDFDADFELYWSIRELAELSLRWSSYQRFRRVKMARLNFDDIIWLTRRLLDSSDAVAADLRNRFEYVLVDEFQDTDREQWEIVKKLSRITDRANVLVVGDVKQAIYGFRGGDVTVMDQAARDMQAAGFEQLSLDFSFRSNPAVTGFCNELFRHCFGRQMDAPYIAKSQDLLVPDNENARNRAEQGKVVILDYDASVLKAGDVDPELEERVKSDRIWLEALRIARMLKRISVGDEPGFERVTRIMQAGEKAAGILLRTRTNQYLFEMALKKYGLPYTVSSGRGFFNRQEISDIGNLLRFLLDAFDDLSLVGVLRSPWVGLSDNGLLAIRNAMNENPARYPTFWPAVKDFSAREMETLIPPDRLSLGLMTDVLEELRRKTKLMRVSELIESALLETNFFAGYRNDRQVVQNVNKLLTVIREMELNGEGTLFEIVNFLTTQAEEEADEKDAELPETGSIQIMTIHGSKGLEFPMVVLADTASGKGGGGVKLHMTPSDERASYNRPGDRSGHRVNHPHTSQHREIDESADNNHPTVLPCFSYNVKDREWNDNAKEGDAAIHAMLKAKTKTREDAEMRRLFYVALTRAETHIVIGNTLSYPGSRRNQSTFALYLNDWLDTLPRPELFEQRTITAAETAALLDGDDPYITGSASTGNRELRLIPRNRLDEARKNGLPDGLDRNRSRRPSAR
jgi:ATP-dependent helicase/nuclease subunit A